jgi:hypothetical protein
MEIIDSNKEFIPYEQAVALKELGFDETCFGFHSKIHGLMMVKTSGSSSLYKDAGECLAPLYQQAFRWFRENYDMIHNVDRIFKDEFGYTITLGDNEPINGLWFNSYEEAELECLKKLIEIINRK